MQEPPIIRIVDLMIQHSSIHSILHHGSFDELYRSLASIHYILLMGLAQRYTVMNVHRVRSSEMGMVCKWFMLPKGQQISPIERFRLLHLSLRELRVQQE